MEIETEKRVSRIIESFSRKRHTPEIEQEFGRWLMDERRRREKDRALFALWNRKATGNRAGRYAALKKIKTRLGHPFGTFRLGIRRFAAAAAIVLCLLAGGSVLYLNQNREASRQSYVALSRKAANTRPGTLTYVATDSATHDVLPDNTQVWLSGNSSLSYRADKAGTVYAELSGEGAFEVETKESSAFIVKTAMLQVKVHGTRFNVREYPGETYTTVTLHNGKVEVILPGGSRFMEPGYLLTYLHDTGETLYDALPGRQKTENTTRNVDSPLNFDKIDLYTILNIVSDYYGFEFSVAEGSYLWDELTVKFDGHETADDLMFVLQHLSGRFSYGIEGNLITVTPL